MIFVHLFSIILDFWVFIYVHFDLFEFKVMNTPWPESKVECHQKNTR